MQGKRLFVNSALMTAVSLLLRSLGLWFQVALSRRMGAAGIGLYSLTASVGSLAATFAISGIRFATTRLVSEEMGQGRLAGVGRVVRRCLAYAAVFGCLAALLLSAGAETVAARFLGDGRTALSLRVLAVGMPFISAGAVLGGYFTGQCRVGYALAGTVTEEVTRVLVSIWLLAGIKTANPELMCAVVAAGSAAGEIVSFFVLLLLYALDHRRRSGERGSGAGLTRRMISIAMPLAATAYARVALNTVQHMLIPAGLRRSGASAEAALAGYGLIQGMVFPVITFPMVLFASLSELIVPELTEEQVRGNNGRIASAANKLLQTTFLFSAAVSAFLLGFSRELGVQLYRSPEAGRYIGLLALLMPAMYMDNITDGMLRGLGEHMYAMKVNIADSLVSTALIWLVLPRYALNGYIVILYLSEFFNFALSLGRLAHVTSLERTVKPLAFGAAAALTALIAAKTAVALTGGVHGLPGLAAGGAVFAGVYAAAVAAAGSPIRRVRAENRRTGRPASSREPLNLGLQVFALRRWLGSSFPHRATARWGPRCGPYGDDR